MRLIRSVGFALAGLRALLKYERNAQWHLVFAIAALITGMLLHLSKPEWLVITLCITGVIAAEAFNTAIEKLCDALHPELDPKIKAVKDLSAAGVLILSLGALVCGGIIFLSRLLAD